MMPFPVPVSLAEAGRVQNEVIVTYRPRPFTLQ